MTKSVEKIQDQVKDGMNWFATYQADSNEVFDDAILADPEEYVKWIHQNNKKTQAPTFREMTA